MWKEGASPRRRKNEATILISLSEVRREWDAWKKQQSKASLNQSEIGINSYTIHRMREKVKREKVKREKACPTSSPGRRWVQKLFMFPFNNCTQMNRLEETSNWKWEEFLEEKVTANREIKKVRRWECKQFNMSSILNLFEEKNCWSDRQKKKKERKGSTFCVNVNSAPLLLKIELQKP